MTKPLFKLQYLRKRKKLTQQQMAELLGISMAHYQKIEQGRRKLTLDIAMKIKGILEVEHIDELFDDAS